MKPKKPHIKRHHGRWWVQSKKTTIYMVYSFGKARMEAIRFIRALNNKEAVS